MSNRPQDNKVAFGIFLGGITLAFLIVLGLTLSGCGEEGGPAEPPPGWTNMSSECKWEDQGGLPGIQPVNPTAFQQQDPTYPAFSGFSIIAEGDCCDDFSLSILFTSRSSSGTSAPINEWGYQIIHYDENGLPGYDSGVITGTGSTIGVPVEILGLASGAMSIPCGCTMEIKLFQGPSGSALFHVQSATAVCTVNDCD